MFTKCGSACPSTCADPHSAAADFCTDVCVKGCQCPSGMVLDEVVYKCVELKQCSKLIVIIVIVTDFYYNQCGDRKLAKKILKMSCIKC